MNKIAIEDIISGKRSKYSLVIAVAKRAREIAIKAEAEGVSLEEKPVNLAIEDIFSHKYEIFEPDMDE